MFDHALFKFVVGHQLGAECKVKGLSSLLRMLNGMYSSTLSCFVNSHYASKQLLIKYR